MSKTKLDATSEQNILNMLMESSSISTEQMSKINATSQEIGKTKLETAFELNFTDEDKIVKILSTSYSMDIIDLKKTVIDPKIKKIIDMRYIQDNSLVPFQMGGGVLKIAIADASKLSLMKNLKTMTKMEPELYAASISNLNSFIERFTKSETQKISDANVKVEKLEKTDDELVEVGSEVIVFGNKLITEAINLGASDIHIESFRDSAQTRFRVDGILKVMDKYSKFLHENYDAVIARIKIISKLDIAERRVPQDGASTFKSDTKEIDLRVSVLPTKNKERVVMRILNKDAGDKALADLGFEAKDLEKLTKAISSPQGMVLVTGPTGSGKTTTLYSVLKHINKPGMNILTAEDPVEYEMEGIGQVQVKEAIGYTFEEALRSFLRQDPEVILVGEIRDKATVDIALKAALTGHLVFSTLHTNDAPSSITRLLNMGTPNYLISAALTLIMAQRLARKTCLDCRVIDENITPKLLNSIGFLPEQSARAKIYKGGGCAECSGSGYKGRMGIYEILEIENELKAGILSNLQQNELNAIAKKNGFRTMQDMGQEMLLSGDLSFAEYERVLQSN
ncbi:GspE/PulE family protein [uncultured Candidatus Pelagibacter sp.]|jgi:type IV pilus assembly protein PilB|uniref:GspE/PulE family protein n=1 Tax=uncultured Candidatus Pelagibacter sp. TaxID=372654 RepID=UPI00261C1937|nr:GspE/PulE family protein [uncultured Candidatus Pelagibacter sp.]